MAPPSDVRLRLRVRMVATLLLLVLTTLVEAFVAGVAVVLALLFLWALVASPESTPSTGVLLAAGVVATVGTLALLARGERDAPAHTVAAMGAEAADESDRPDLLALVRGVAQQADAPVPSVYVAPADAPFSSTAGFRPESSRLIVSRGLLDVLDDDELRAVLAHEVAHVKNRDAAVMTAAAFPVGAAGRVRDLLSGPTVGVEHGTASRADRADALVTVGLLFAAPLAVCTFLLWTSLSRSREFAADRAAAAVTGDPAALARALERIDGALGERPATDLRRTEVAAFAVVDPRRGTAGSSPADRLPVGRLFDTHPPVTERVARLDRAARTQESTG